MFLKIAIESPVGVCTPVLRFETYMYCVGKRADGGGMRISAAAQTAPGDGFAGMMEAVEMIVLVPFGKDGIACTVSVDVSS
jgi:hypothetical protein